MPILAAKRRRAIILLKILAAKMQLNSYTVLHGIPRSTSARELQIHTDIACFYALHPKSIYVSFYR